MSKLRTPFRYDFVGSFLRPERLKEARAARARGEISDQALEKVEEECIADLVRKQKELGYHGITDGEFRRSYWHLDFMWGCRDWSISSLTTAISFMVRRRRTAPAG